MAPANGGRASTELAVAGYPVTAPVVGGMLVAASALFAWIAPGGVRSSNAFKVPLTFLVDNTPKPGGPKLGFLLLLLGAAGVVLSTARPEPVIRRVIGAVVVGLGLLFLVQFQRALRGWEFLPVLGNIGLGVPMAIGGGVLLWGRGPTHPSAKGK